MLKFISILIFAVCSFGLQFSMNYDQRLRMTVDHVYISSTSKLNTPADTWFVCDSWRPCNYLLIDKQLFTAC